MSRKIYSVSMQRIIHIILVIGFIFCWNFSTAQEKIKIVSSASMFYDMAKNITGDLAENELIVPIGGDPHLYEPKPSDAQLIAEADLVLINGLTFEGWILQLIKNSGANVKVDTITNGIDAIRSSTYQDAYDPHAWMDLSMGLIYINNIKNAVIKLDPANEAAYVKNYNNYKKRLVDLDNYIKNRIDEIDPDKRVIITTHDAFAYYGRRYGLTLEALMGISTESDATAKDMRRVGEAIKKYNVPALFVESTINPKIIEQIAKDNKIKVGGELFTDSIGPEGSEGNSYYDMMKHNTDVIVNALTGQEISDRKFEANSKEVPEYFYILIVVVLLVLLVPIVMKMNK